MTTRPYQRVSDSLYGSIEYSARIGSDGFVILSAGLSPANFRIRHAKTEPLARADGTIGSHTLALETGPRRLRRRTYAARATLARDNYVLRPTSAWTAVLCKNGDVHAKVRRLGPWRRTVTWRHQPTGPDEVAVCHALCCFAGIGARGAFTRIIGNTVGVIADVFAWP